MHNGIRLAALLGALLVGQAAWSIPATYSIDSGALPGNSANWLYRVNNKCNGTSDLDLNSNNKADVLHFCGSTYHEVDGYISGEWDGEKLTGLSGMIIDGKILGGSLGGAFYGADMTPLWTIVTDLFGTFVFEELDPAVNVITENSLTLWGQNLTAYGLRELCTSSTRPGLHACAAKALDAAGAPTSVPEPTALAMLALGLGAVTWTVRRRAGARSGR